MKTLLLLAASIAGCFLSLPTAQAKEKKQAWIENLDAATGVPWLPMPAGKAVYHFGWSGFKAAEAELNFSHPGKGLVRLEATGRTVGAARLVFRLDTHAFFWTNVAKAHPMRVRVRENYGDRVVVLAEEFGSKAVSFSKARIESGSPPADLMEAKSLSRSEMKELNGRKGKRFKLSGMLDLQSALFYLRAQSLKPGETRSFLVFHGTAPYRVELKAGKSAMIKIAAGEFRAIPFSVEMEWVDKKHRLRKHKNFRSATVWISDDPSRLLLKVESEVFVGKIWAELISFQPESGGLPLLPAKADSALMETP